MKPKIAAVVLNYNGAEDTIACVQSLKACAYPDLRILVVDNGSSDGSSVRLREALLGVDVAETGRNLGFAGGNNFGMRLARSWDPEFFLIINNDTVVEPDFLDPLVEALSMDPDSAASTGTICYYPEKEVVQYAGGDLIGWRASGFSRYAGTQFSALADHGVSAVTFASGCLMLLRATDLETTGMFDERFFLYCEDAELCLRLVQAGKRLLYVPRSRIYHRMGHRSERPLPYYFMYRNRLLLVDLLPSGIERMAARMYFLISTALKLVVWRFRRPDLYLAGRMGLEDHGRGVFYEGRAAAVAAIPVCTPVGGSTAHSNEPATMDHS